MENRVQGIGKPVNPMAQNATKQVLFVDDEPAFLSMIRQLAAQSYGEGWNVHTAVNASQALSLLQSQRIDLAVVDVQMPVIDGIQFLALLNRRFPHLQKVVLTGFASEQYRTACLSGGAELFLEKPRTVDGFEVIFAAINELARWQPEEGFRGVLRKVGIQDIIQMECLNRHSVIMEISGSGAKGVIYIQDGEFVHAQLGEKSGEAAVNALMSLRGGEFALKSFITPPSRTIHGQWEFVLMEAFRQRDEAGDPEAKPQVYEPAASVIESLDGGEQAALDAHPMPAQSRPRSRIDEVLICSDQGEVLYDHRCPDANTRINLMEFISQRSRQMSQALPMGRLDRVEFSATSSRMIAQFQNGCGIVVRSTALPPP